MCCGKFWRRWLSPTAVLHLSERDGFTHLYLTTVTRTQTQRGGGANATSEGLQSSSSSSSSSWETRQLTGGRWVVHRIVRICSVAPLPPPPATTCKDDEGWLAVVRGRRRRGGARPYYHLCRLMCRWEKTPGRRGSALS